MTKKQLEQDLRAQYVYSFEHEGLTEENEAQLQDLLTKLEIRDQLGIESNSGGPAWGASLTFTGIDQHETKNAAICVALWIQRHHGKINL